VKSASLCPGHRIRAQFPLSNIQVQCRRVVLTAKDLLFCGGKPLAEITP
jgi:hypothetical protein